MRYAPLPARSVRKFATSQLAKIARLCDDIVLISLLGARDETSARWSAAVPIG
jgi:hypothetical protein